MISDKQLVEFCQEAIKTPSYSGREEALARLYKAKMEEFGFDEVSFDYYGNVIGKIKGKLPGKRILMDGHMDTVDVIDAEKWEHDPFGGEIVDGKIYGRGASDMKGSDTAMIVAAGRFAQSNGKNFKGEIYVSGTVHEECFEGISSIEVCNNVKPDFVIIGEATSGTVKIGQRGRAEVVVETEGVSCHSSNPEKGVNAVYHMASLIEEIRKIKPNEHPVLGKGILELTDIKSFPYPGASVVPSLCRATFDRRTLVGEDEAVILGQIEKAIDETKKKIPELKARCYLAVGEQKCWNGNTIKAKKFYPAWCYDKEDPTIQSVYNGLKKAGIDTKFSHYSFCTNGSGFCGTKGVLGIGYGPSEEYLAHVRNEYIEIENLQKACRGFECILNELAGVSQQ